MIRIACIWHSFTKQKSVQTGDLLVYSIICREIWPNNSLGPLNKKSPPKYAISQLWIVCSVLHLVTYLDVGNFSDKSTETTLNKIFVQIFLRFSDSSKSSQSISLIYKLAWLAGIRKSEENLLKTSCKVAPVAKAVTSRQSKTIHKCVCEHWCDVVAIYSVF